MSDALLAELRASAPPAPEDLRARVEAIAAREPTRASWREWIRPGRALVVAAPTALAAMLTVAVVHGLSAAPEPAADRGRNALSGMAPEAQGAKARERATKTLTGQPPRSALGSRNSGRGSAGAPTAPPASRTRAQDYQASLTVRLRDVASMSDAVKAAMRSTRAWGGYVVAAQYTVPGRNGDARLEVRIPVQHVQAAIQRFSGLGTLTGQDIAILDVQGKLDAYTRQLLALRERIAKLHVQLSRPGLTAAQQAQLELQLARATRTAASLRAEQATLKRRASFATVTLTLTTRAAAAAAPHKQGRVERTLRDAAGVLALELAFGLYALIVVAPFTLLALIAYLAARGARRRADDRLLGSA